MPYSRHQHGWSKSALPVRYRLDGYYHYRNFFFSHFANRGTRGLKDCNWLDLTAANGLDLPYLGYLELDIEVLDKNLPKRGVLIVRDPCNSALKKHKSTVPGVLGMNVVWLCFKELYEKYGPELFQSPPVLSAAPAWKQALRACEQMDAVVNAPSPFKVRVQGGSPIRVPAGTLSMIPVTCPQVPLREPVSLLLEPLELEEGALPVGLLVSPCLVLAERGTLFAPITTVGNTDVMLHPRKVVATVQCADVVRPDAALSEPSAETSSRYTVSVSTQIARTETSVSAILELTESDGLSEQEAVVQGPSFTSIKLCFLRVKEIWDALTS